MLERGPQPQLWQQWQQHPRLAITDISTVCQAGAAAFQLAKAAKRVEL